MRGIPIADDTGHLAGWIEGRGDHLRMIAYDTVTHRIVGQAEADAETFVTAVDGDTIIFVTAEDSFRWQPGGTEAPQRIDIGLLKEPGSPASSWMSRATACWRPTSRRPG